jgi:protein kinase D
MHCFEIRTTNVDYFIGEDPLHAQKDPTKVTMLPPESGIGSHLAKSWETAIRQALMPVTPQGNNNNATTRKFVSISCPSRVLSPCKVTACCGRDLPWRITLDAR